MEEAVVRRSLAMNRSLPALFAAVLAIAPAALAAAPAVREYRVDSSHSRIAWSIPFMGSHVRGEFDDVKGILSVDPALSSRCGVTVRIAAASLHTGSAHRDEHLRSDDFFDADKFPAVGFRSDGLRCDRGACALTGALTLHGVTKPIRIDVTQTLPPTADPHGVTVVEFHGITRLARKDFGILGGSKHNTWFDDLRSRTMGDTVEVELDLHGFAIDYDKPQPGDASVARVEQNGISGVLGRMRSLAATPDSLAGMSWGIEQLGFALISRGRAGEGLAVLRTFAEVLPDTASGYGMLARGYELAGKADSSQIAARLVLAKKPDDPRAGEVVRRGK